ncbi:HRAS-like suppressor 3 [Poecilia latipinna]|uniref:Retinoic acid receptor responder 3 n=1 Tax=Poecilia formosa TaxID=48698 RepID=A0A087XAG0_POEFO|nr:PREDICTED: HRAS-like suppressor 3 [Poecilia formosa]XP_014876508.1 PREDICTED: HRAS-like suppressor 3 [Poecilia latipinna]
MAPVLFDIDAKPGDLIEIFGGVYHHWAVFIGGNEVIHLIPSTHRGGDLLEVLAFLGSSDATVRRQRIWEVVGSNRFQVNNLLDDKYQPLDPSTIVSNAVKMVGQERPYNVATHNSEHFVTELRYGKPESRQVQTAAVIGGVAAAGVAVAVVGAALFSAFRKNKDKE